MGFWKAYPALAEGGIATVRHFAHQLVLEHHGSLIRINPREPEIGNLRGIGIAGGALHTLSAIDALLQPKSGRAGPGLEHGRT